MQDDLEYKKENQNSWYGLILYVKSTLLRFDMPYFVANMDKISYFWHGKIMVLSIEMTLKFVSLQLHHNDISVVQLSCKSSQ